MRRQRHHLTPRQLDWLLNGVPIYIRRAPIDGKAYATMHDYSKFLREEPLETLRVRFDRTTPADWDPTTDHKVVAAVERWNAQG